MKKLASIFLALVMILGLSVNAFAENETPDIPHTTKVTFNDTTATTRSYNGYQLLSLKVSMKSDEHHPATCTGTHTDDCYNYAYTVNEKYRAILQAEALAYGGYDVWSDSGAPDAAEKVTDDQIKKHLAAFTSDNGDIYGSLRRVADRIYRAIADAEPAIEADAEAVSGADNVINQGYWMFVDITNIDDATDANSMVILDTAGDETLTVNPKVSIPAVEKKVKDIDNSEDANIEDNRWQDSADHDINDTVPFKLVATLPNNLRAYNTYKLIFHDTLSAGLSLNQGSIQVRMYESKHQADADSRMNNGVLVAPANYTVTSTENGFDVTFNNVLGISNISSNYAIVVYYNATLNENAVVGAEGNPNKVKLEFSNNPYDNTQTGETSEDEVIVFTYQLTVNKIDSHGHALKGAGFTLYKYVLQNDTIQEVKIGSELKGADMTEFTWKGLDDGDYKLVESTVPEGYNALADVEFSITANHDEHADDPQLTTLDGGKMGIGEVVDGKLTGIIVKDIVNNTGTVLPETGAQGTMMLIGGGSLFVIVAAVFMVTRKKMSVYAD